MSLGQFFLEKNKKNAPRNSFRDGFFAVEPKQPERKRSTHKGNCARTGKFLKFLVRKKLMAAGVSGHFMGSYINYSPLLVLFPQTIP